MVRSSALFSVLAGTLSELFSDPFPEFSSEFVLEFVLELFICVRRYIDLVGLKNAGGVFLTVFSFASSRKLKTLNT